MQRLDWRHIDLVEGHIEIVPSVSKTGRRRIIDIEPTLAEWLNHFIANYGEATGRVTPHPNLRDRLRAIRKAAGLGHWTQDAARHSFASYWLSAHGEINKLVLFLGHGAPTCFGGTTTRRQAQGRQVLENCSSMTRPKVHTESEGQSVKPAEVQWRLVRAERRALDGPQFKSPAVVLARTLNRMRKLLLDQRDQNGRSRIYSYAIEHCQKRARELLPLVSMPEVARALTKLEKTDFGSESAEKVVLEAYARIFERTRREPESGRAVYNEIEAMAKNERKVKLPWESTVDDVLNRLELPTGQGKRGPKRGPRPKKTSKKRA